MLVIGTSRGLMTAGPDETPNKTPNAGAGSFVTLLGSIVSSIPMTEMHRPCNMNY